MRKILLTGGCGFIGSHILDLLCDRECDVLVVDNLSTGSLNNVTRHIEAACCEIVRLDVASPDLMALVARHQPDVVLHLAAQSTVVGSMADPYQDAMANVVGSVNVAIAAHTAGVPRLVCAASGGTIYDDYRTPALANESGFTTQPRSPYALSKRVMVEYLTLFEQLYSMNWTALAIGNAFGPRQDPATGAGVVSIFASALLRDNPVRIFGDGKSTRDYVYVEDVARAFAHVAEIESHGMYNVASGVSRSVLEVLDHVAAVLGIDAPDIEWEPSRPGDVYEVMLDVSPIQAIGWEPTTSFDDGVRALVADLKAEDVG